MIRWVVSRACVTAGACVIAAGAVLVLFGEQVADPVVAWPKRAPAPDPAPDGYPWEPGLVLSR
jgi:hypothetical protein